ncbi:hypothetical protein ACP0HM_11565 [Escherichia coli]
MHWQNWQIRCRKQPTTVRLSLCNGDPDDLILKLADMPGEKVAKVKVGLYEAVRDGMVVNLLLEAIPDLHLRLDANRALNTAERSAVCQIR